MSDLELLTRQQVEKLIGIKRSTIYKLMREGVFPEPIKISGGTVRWPKAELETWVNSRPRARGERACHNHPNKKPTG